MIDLTLLSIFLSFSVIIFLVAKRKNFAISVFAGIIILSVFDYKNLPENLYKTATDWTVIALIFIIFLINLLSTILQEGGAMGELVKFLSQKLSYRGLLIAIPSLFGMLPVPGGALMSAPLIDKGGEKNELTFLNLWYRHVWFIILPISTPLVLVADLAGVSIYKLILMQFPIFLLSFFLAMPVVKKFSRKKEKESEGNYLAIFPILLTVSLAIILSFFMHTYLSFLISLSIGIILAVAISMKRKIYFLKKGLVSLLIAIFGIMLLKNMIISMKAPEIIYSYLSNFNPVAMIAIIPFLVGTITANNLAAIGILYPLLSPFIFDIKLVSLLYISSFIGYLVSPVHPCLVLTYEYFKPKLTDLYKLLLPPAILVIIISAIIYSL
ncbi:MAG: DUF401 family protein [Thermoplasmatales archaeon]|nr:DUF401 family protein [Thermoplasmatales archaeon]